jgi:hypothetical protein
MESLEEFRDIHDGRACFLFGAGPSLHFIEADRVRNHVTIAVNSGIMKVKWCDYFVSDDIGIVSWNYYTEILPKLNCKKLLYKDKLKDHCDHLSDVFLFEHTWWYSPEKKEYNYNGLILNKTGPIIGSRVSMGSALHFAYLMGCNPIILLGNDCRIKDGKRYFWQYEGEESPQRISGPSFSKSTQNFGFDQYSFVEYWSVLASVNKDLIQSSLNIIDCSDSALNCFQKMSFEEAIKVANSKST